METLYKNKWLGILMLVLLTANIITLAFLWTNNQHHAEEGLPPGPGGGPAFEFVIKELNFDKQQQDQYKTLREEHQQQQRPLADSLLKAKNDYFNLLKDTAVTDARLQEFSSKTVALQQQIELINFRHFQKLRAICNAEQKQKFDNILEEILKRFANRRPPFLRGGRPGPGREDGPPPPP